MIRQGPLPTKNKNKNLKRITLQANEIRAKTCIASLKTIPL